MSPNERVFHLDTPLIIPLMHKIWFGLLFSISGAVLLIFALRCDCSLDIKPLNPDPQEHLYIDEGQGEPIIWEH